MIEIKEFTINDIGTLSLIMKDAFNFDSRMHLNKDDGPEGYDDGSFINKWFLLDSASPYTIWYDNKLIGAINLFINNETNIFTSSNSYLSLILLNIIGIFSFTKLYTSSDSTIL